MKYLIFAALSTLLSIGALMTFSQTDEKFSLIFGVIFGAMSISWLVNFYYDRKINRRNKKRISFANSFFIVLVAKNFQKSLQKIHI